MTNTGSSGRQIDNQTDNLNALQLSALKQLSIENYPSGLSDNIKKVIQNVYNNRQHTTSSKDYYQSTIIGTLTIQHMATQYEYS